MPWMSMFTRISSQIGTKLRDWAVGQARAGCYSQAALSSNDSKALYNLMERGVLTRSSSLLVMNETVTFYGLMC